MSSWVHRTKLAGSGTAVAVLVLVLTAATVHGDTIYVDDDAPLGGDGLSWDTAFKYLQDALGAAAPGDEIRVAGGVYKPDRDEAGNVTPGDREATFELISSVGLFGGYRGLAGGGDPDDRDIGLFETILSGDLAADDGPDFEHYDENSYHVAEANDTDPAAVLDGISLTGGNANGSWQYDLHRGGGLYTRWGNPTLVNCTFSGNRCEKKGGGVYSELSALELTGSVFHGNEAGVYGGGIFQERGDLTLTDCAFNENSAHSSGGGVYSERASFYAAECTFAHNDVTSGMGGGLTCFHTDGTLLSCAFSENISAWGGGVHIGSSDLVVTGCTFVGNTAEHGGGLHSYYSDSLVIAVCTFTENWASEDGGGMLARNTDDAVVSECVFAGNSSVNGGGVYNWDSSDLIVVDCEFGGNVASDCGGGMYNNRGYSPLLESCIFGGNTARAGGAVYDYRSDIRMVNCIFTHNSASESGGAVHHHERNDPTLAGCTLVGNSAPMGTAIACDSPALSYPQVINCILWNGGDEIHNSRGAAAAVSFSNVQGGWLGIGNIDADPLFVDPDGPDDDGATWEDNDYRLGPGSPCVNHGTDDAPSLPEEDFEGESRVQQCQVDIGADESPHFFDCNTNGEPDACDILDGLCQDCNANGTPDECDILEGHSPDGDGNGVPDECELAARYVDGTAPEGGNGLSWEEAYTDLQVALLEAKVMGYVVREIWVSAGSYRPDVGTGYRGASFEQLDGVGLYGGFAGWETEQEQRDWVANETILSGDLLGDDGPDFENYGENTYHVVTCNGCDQTAILDGFIVAGGYADGPHEADQLSGAGMYNRQGGPAVRNCVFRDNWAGDWASGSGAGMYNYEGSPTVSNCTFAHNSARDYGGGMYNVRNAPVLNGCAFDDNSAFEGGGLASYAVEMALSDCTFSANSATWGGGMFTQNSVVTLSACLFSDNYASDGGGIANQNSTHAALDGCVFVGNEAGGNGGGMYSYGNYGDSNPTVVNCVFSDNVAGSNGGAMFNTRYSSPLVINCTFARNETTAWRGGGVYNQGVSPLFVACTFERNTARDGGGMYNGDIYSDGCHATLVMCSFRANVAREGGGGVCNDSDGAPCEATLVNCIFSSNVASGLGGGVLNYNYQGSSIAVVRNCTFAANAASKGSALACDSYGQQYPDNAIDGNNCIIWDGAEGVWSNDGSPIGITYSAVQWGWPGEGNTDADPLFVDLEGGDLHLSHWSPCIDAADNEAVPADEFDLDEDGDTDEPIPFDLDGNPRFVDDPATEDTGNGVPPIVDMGAYEFQAGAAAFLDIKPGSCPNPLNRNSQGVLPVALVGTEDFDVTQVDLDSLELTRADGLGGSVTPLMGPPGPGIHVEDVATPFDGEPCDCHELEGDGIADLAMKFDTLEMVAVLELEDLPGGAPVELIVSGELLDTTYFSAADCVVLVPPGWGSGALGAESAPEGDGIDAVPESPPNPRPADPDAAQGDDAPDELSPQPVGCGILPPGFLLTATAATYLIGRPRAVARPPE